MTHTDKRLIEDYIPIKAISAEASREKSIRHGHISTLHLWWARRPLVASRAAVFAALVPAGKTADEKRELNDLMIRLCKWEVDQRTLDEARERIRQAYPDAPPKVLDMFAGGGAIPLEALRLGCEAYALDLNPVAHIIELATLVYPQKYGKKLAEDVRKWGEWVLERVRAEVGDLYPLIPDPDFTPEQVAQQARLSGNQMALPLAPHARQTAPHPQPLSHPGERGEGFERIEISPEMERRMIEVARQLRQETTPSEEVLWQALRNRQLDGFKFRRQQPIGPFVLDFFCPEARLAVEVDGPIHDTQREADAQRQELIEMLGIRFVRVTASDVMNSLDMVLSRISAALSSAAPHPKSLSLPGERDVRSWDAAPPSPHRGRGAGGEGDDVDWDEDDEDVPDNTTADVPFGYLQPVAYLWTRTVTCPNPACRATVPLVRQTWLKKKKGDNVALEMKPHPTENRMAFHVRHARDPKDFGFDPAGFSQRGNSVCGRCGTTVTNDYVKAEGKAGRMSAQMIATVCINPSIHAKTYLSPDDLPIPIPNEEVIRTRINNLIQETGIRIPDGPLVGKAADQLPAYGMSRYADLFSARQLLTMLTFVKHMNTAREEMGFQGYEEEYARAVLTFLAIVVDKMALRHNTMCTWATTSSGGRLTQAFSRQALAMVWDYAEANAFSGTSGDFMLAVDDTLRNVTTLSEIRNLRIHVDRGSAESLPYTDSSVDAIITDPPYYDYINYSDISDFFYVWLKRTIGQLFSAHFSTELTPKKKEAIASPYRHETHEAAAEFYEQKMNLAFAEAHRVLKPNGFIAIVYAHKTTVGWSTLIDSLRKTGFSVTEAWPLMTELAGNLKKNVAALASSIFLVARRRNNGHTACYIDDIQPEMKRIVKERVSFFLASGIAGADLSIATVGAALAPYTRYARVELPNGAELTAAAYLDEVQREVVRVVLGEASKADERTQYYLMARANYGEAWVEFDEANNLARALGVELDTGPEALTRGGDALVEKKGSKVRLRTFEERGDLDDLGLPTPERPKAPLIDVLHRLLWLVEHDNSLIQEFLGQALPDKYLLRVVAQSLQGKALASEPTPGAMLDERTPEQRAIQTLLASWRRIVDEGALL